PPLGARTGGGRPARTVVRCGQGAHGRTCRPAGREDHDRRRTRRGRVLPRVAVRIAARRAGGRAPAAEAVGRTRSPRRRVNPRLELLAAYPFERLARLKAGAAPPAN